MGDPVALELEHAIGFSGSISPGLHAIGADRYAAVVGPSVICSSATNAHEQQFLRGHSDHITCSALSPSVRLPTTQPSTRERYADIDERDDLDQCRHARASPQCSDNRAVAVPNALPLSPPHIQPVSQQCICPCHN